ncbi:MAG: hypothetical protein AAF687_04800, partial [Pseudomonadota bacterium]
KPMYLRISSGLIALALLAACGPESAPPEGNTVACAIGEGSAFAEVCTLEASEKAGVYLIHSPDGGFRRIMFDPAAGEFGSVDGADELTIIEQNGSFAEFTIAGDRYRVPHRLVRDEP